MIAAIAVNLETSNQVKTSNTILSAKKSYDGTLLVTTSNNHTVTVWDLKHHKRQVIATHSSDYHAHFIKNTHNVMWHDNVGYNSHTTHIT